MTVTLINAGLPEDAFSTLCDFCREELPRRGIPYSTDGDYRITVGTDAALTNDPVDAGFPWGACCGCLGFRCFSRNRLSAPTAPAGRNRRMETTPERRYFDAPKALARHLFCHALPEFLPRSPA